MTSGGTETFLFETHPNPMGEDGLDGVAGTPMPRGGAAVTRTWGGGAETGKVMADREGFEPSIRFHVYTRSRRAPSTTRPPVHPSAAVGQFGWMGE